MKRAARWSCLLIFLILCTVTVWFLQCFTESKESEQSVQYIDWQSAVKIEADGSETPYTQEDYANLPEKGDSFRLTALLPADMEDGNLLFETSGLELAVELNGDQIWKSSAKTPEGAINQTQAVIPLPENATGELVMTCTVQEETVSMFPPMLRVESLAGAEASAYAYANFYGIPAGASAIVMLLVAGLFLLGVLRRRIDWSLIPLFLAAVGLTVRWISQGLGYYFLPEAVSTAFSWNGVGLLTFGMLVLFLIMNRRRDFWRYFGMAAAGSAAAFAASYLISLATDGYLSYYIRLQIDSLVQSGYYDNLLYWFTIWMTVVCAVISAYVIMRSFAKQQAEAQALNLKNQLVMDSYRAIETKMRDSAELRHELNHRILAMDALYQKGDYEALGEMLTAMKKQSDRQTYFTENFTINAILQDAASRAAKADISFQAQAHVPAELPIPENHLCELLMNMLDNALEAAEKVEDPKKRFIRFRTELKDNFLAVKCENSFTGTVLQDETKGFLTKKDKQEAHGFGMKLMEAVTEQYRSILDVSYSEDNVFTVQTALQLPKKK